MNPPPPCATHILKIHVGGRGGVEFRMVSLQRLMGPDGFLNALEHFCGQHVMCWKLAQPADLNPPMPFFPGVKPLTKFHGAEGERKADSRTQLMVE